MSKDNNYLINPFTGHDVWIHSTYFTDPQTWVKIDPSKKSERRDRFYIGAGANLFKYGEATVFVKYKPTKLFNARLNHFGYTYEEANRFLDCVWNELLKADDKTKKHFLNAYFHNFEDECSVEFSEWELENLNIVIEDFGFGPCDEDDIKGAIRENLYNLLYTFYEEPFIQHCLINLGYSGYMEADDELHYSTPSYTNVAVFESDFDNIEILGILSPMQNEKGEAGYQCPKCKGFYTTTFYSEMEDIENTEAMDFIMNILKTGNLECHKCAIQWSKHHRKNPITMEGRIGLDSVPMQFFDFYNDDGELVGEGDYEIVNSFEDMRLRWNHAPHEPELTALKNAINDQFPVGVLVDIKISRLHRGKGYGQQITRETIEHMINSEGAKTILVIVETHPEEPYDLIPWYEMQGFEDLGIKTQWRYPLMILR